MRLQEESLKLPVSQLDVSLYHLDDESKAFFKRETGIQDDEEVKAHIVAVQNKAYSVFQYPCFRTFDFVKSTMGEHPMYAHLLELGKQRNNAIFLDLACCCSFGQDARKAVRDGYPVQNILASDLRAEFWSLGHELFRSDDNSFPAAFIQGDIFDKSFLDPTALPPKETHAETNIPPLKSLTSLNPLRGYLSACYCGNLFHLFDEDAQRQLAKALAGLLSPEPGSMIFGAHLALAKKGMMKTTGIDGFMFCHSPDSWKELWQSIFGKDAVEVTAELRVYPLKIADTIGVAAGDDTPVIYMDWSVLRK
ncbi:hypothetical protein C8R42DRAFT_596483 [Lentinula raphanica]|nr:hypothetical protein C8R42DRAFT_596483 [Lentinula raphanica]